MIHAMIMAGGKGTRFWPLSRNAKPKQFLSILNSKTLLENTIDRLSPLVDADNVWILGNLAYEAHFKALNLQMPDSQLLYEPCAKNTAPCIGWAAVEALRKDPEAVMIVLPSDHFIAPEEKFREVLSKAVSLVRQDDCLVTIGIKPTFPHTGFGYIEVDVPGKSPANVLCFHEKPELAKATAYVESGRFLWNSGMFIWSARKILDLFKQFLPHHYEILMNIQADPSRVGELFQTFESISIDYGIMEKAMAETRLLVSEFDWNDIGSWSALDDFWPNDEAGNAVKGDVLCVNSHQNVVYAPSKKIILVDVDNVVVVDTDDALLILPKKSDQKTKDLQDLLPKALL